MGKYDSFYREDIERMINDQALKTMLSPVRKMNTVQQNETDGFERVNDRIAQYNEGVRALAMVLVNELSRMGEETHE